MIPLHSENEMTDHARVRGFASCSLIVVALCEVDLDRVVAERLAQFSVQQVVQEVAVAVVEPDVVVLVPVVPLRTAVCRAGVGEVRKKRVSGQGWGDFSPYDDGSRAGNHSEEEEGGGGETRLFGLESQICLLGGCLLRT